MQATRRAVFPPGEAREDWKIIRALSAAVGRPLAYDSLAELRRRLYAAHPILAATDQVTAAAWGRFGRAGPIDPGPFTYPITDFYRTDPISRASPTMAECAEILLAHHGELPPRTGTHG